MKHEKWQTEYPQSRRSHLGLQEPGGFLLKPCPPQVWIDEKARRVNGEKHVQSKESID
jgi:hypothetical protein